MQSTSAVPPFTLSPVRPGHRLLRSPAIRAIEARGLAATPPGTLMARAARALADACGQWLRQLPARTPVLALAGPGNNGGDALLAALELADRGWRIHGLALSATVPEAADARAVWHRWAQAGHPLHPPEALESLLAERPLVIDGLFGIGLDRPLPDPATRIVRHLNAARLPVVAVDVPSGLDADRGCIVGGPEASAVLAGITVTMIADKPGLRTGLGPLHSGRVVVADLAVPAAVADINGDSGDPQTECGLQSNSGWLIEAETVCPWLPPRTADAHKGRFGDVLVIAGAPEMHGASLLAALGAQAVGCGRLYLGVASESQTTPDHPELMTRRIAAHDTDAAIDLGPATAIVIGCGLGRGLRAQSLLRACLAHPAALVVDADGLNLIASDEVLRLRLCERARSGRPTVITPHPLEAARLLGTPTATVQSDRIAAALRLASTLGVCALIKGAGTVVATPDGRWSVNASGGPLLSVAGTGDVLAGVIGGLLAGGSAPLDAAVCGAWLHGAAADALASQPQWSRSIGLPASRLADAIRATINRPDDRC